jgi:hypothetical protein
VPAATAGSFIRVEGAMLQESVIAKLVLQVLGVGAYFGLVVILYWWRLTDAGAVAIILGLLFLFKSVVDSGAISLRGFSPSDPGFNIGTLGGGAIQGAQFPRRRTGGMDRPRQGDADGLGTSEHSGRCHPFSNWFASSPFASPVASLDLRWR